MLWYGTPFAYVNGSTLNPTITNQRVRIDIIQTTANLLITSIGVLQLVHASTSASPSTFGPTTITADVTALAGQTVRLRCALVGTSGAIIAGIDNVKLDVSPFTSTTLPVALDTGAARFGDFDNDGKFEVAQMGSDGSNGVWSVARWDAPTGQWVQANNLIGMRDGDIALADIDRDGDLDMGGVGTTMSRVHDLAFQRNDGGFSFTFVQQPALGSDDPGTRFGSIDWGDFDTDGDLDAIVTGTGGAGTEYSATRVEVNNGSGSFETWGLAGVPSVTGGNALWDALNDDDRLDVTLCGAERSASFLYQPTGYGTMIFDNLPAVTEGALALGDLNNDGRDDLVLTGMSGSMPITKVYRLESFFGSVYWNEIASGQLTGVYQSSVSLGDFDHDGSCDIAICGNTGSGVITRVYHNNGNETFTDVNAALPGVKLGTVEFGDFDGDGDLDLLVQGNDGANRIARVYVNSTPGTSLGESLSGPTLTLSLDPLVSDDHTVDLDLTSNLRAGASPGGCDVISPMSNLSNGRRMIPRCGATHGVRTIPLTAIGHGSLYWSAQTVDRGFLGSSWASERVFTPGPRITQIKDVPGDQGGHLRLTLDKSMLDDDANSTYPASGYDVWRLVPPGAMTQTIAREGVAATARPGADATTGLERIEWKGRSFTRSQGVTIASPFPAGTWEIVGSYYATQQPTYLVASTTLADSGVAGIHDETFIVTVHTTTPSVWFASLPVSGHSVDNLAPSSPTGLTAAHHTGSGNQLAWQPAPEPDFGAFHVYRGNTPGFVPGPSNLVASVTNPSWTDPSYDSPVVYYRVSTLDHAGNESPAVAPGSTTAVDAPDVPLEFALLASSPNPFAGDTRIGFALPRATDVRLEVFAGKHEARWSGADQAGRRVEAGLYFYRLRAGTFTASRRVAFVP